MRAWILSQFGLEHLSLRDLPAPSPGPEQVCVRVRSLSLNYRDLLVIRGHYNAGFPLPATPISDAAGVVESVGPGVTRWKPGDGVMGNFIAGWIDGPFQAAYLGTTLGMPGPGMAAELVCLPQEALLAIPSGFDFAQAATLPIAALTAWSALITEGGLFPDVPAALPSSHGGAVSSPPALAGGASSPASNAGKWVVTLGTGGVSIFALQFAKAIGASVIITSSDDRKLDRARALGADRTINYRQNPDWEKLVIEMTGGFGADITVETGGAGTLEHSLKATRHGGRIGMLGALTGLKSEITVGLMLMKRLRVCGIMVDCRRAFEDMSRFIDRHALKPVIDRVFSFEELPSALRLMEAGGHFGKIVVMT